MEEGRSDGSNEGSDGEYPDVNIDENCSDMKTIYLRKTKVTLTIRIVC